MTTRNDILRDFYYNNKLGLINFNQFYKYVNKGSFHFTHDEVKEFYDNQEVNQLHKPQKTIKYYPITGNFGSYQADLTFYDQYKKSNGGYHILLTVININTRKAYVEPLKSKTEESVTTAFKKIIEQAQDMKTLTTDNGSEFKSKFTKMLKENNIEHILVDTGTKTKTGKIERFNRTIRNKIERYLTAYNTNKYIDVLPEIVEQYNNTVHSSIGLTPNKVTMKKEKEIMTKDRQAINNVDKNIIRFNVGDKVRLKKTKEQFSKLGETYTKGLYEISKVNPMSYRIKNESGDILKRTVKHYELQLIYDVQTAPKKDNEFDRNIEKKEVKIERDLKKEGVDTENIIENKRERKIVYYGNGYSFTILT